MGGRREACSTDVWSSLHLLRVVDMSHVNTGWMVSVLLHFGIMYRNLIEPKSCTSVCTCAAWSHVSGRDCCRLLVEISEGNSINHIGRLGTYPTQSAAIIVSCSCASREALERARAKLARLPNLDLSPKHPCSVCPALRHSHPNPSLPPRPFTQSRTYIAAVSLAIHTYFSLPAFTSPSSSVPALHTSRRPARIPASQRWVSTTHSRRPWRVSPPCPTTPALVALPSCRPPSPSAGHPGLGTTGCYLARNKTMDQRNRLTDRRID